jgi:RimK family alpha-L-glutamate ligase
MRFGYLGSAKSWYYRELTRVAGSHHIVPLSFEGLWAALGGVSSSVHATGEDLNALDAILVRVMKPGSLEQVVFRMDTLAEYERLGGVLVNGAKAVEAAVDKYLTLAKLARCGLPVPPTVVCQTAGQALEAFFHLGQDVVVKPLFGSEGRGLYRIQEDAIAERVFRTLENIQAVLYVQKFIRHGGRDLRLLVIGERVLGMQRFHPSDWRTNVSRGAQVAAIQVSAELEEMAQRAAAAVGATLAGIDIVYDADGQPYVLEVNASPGWQGLQQATQLDVAQLVLEHLISRASQGADQRT